MLYEEYKRKIERLNNIILWIKKRRFYIVALFMVIFALICTAASFKGVIYSSGDFSPRIEYGQDIDYSARAFLSGVKYEYRSEDLGVWSTEIPFKVGSYRLRSVSNGVFGATKYSRELSFEIVPKSIDVFILDENIQYGESPSVYAEVAYLDTIECNEFDFEGFYEETTIVSARLDAIKILDENGNDNTLSYRINIVPCSVSFNRREISLKTADKSKIYDGQPISAHEFEIISGSLIEGNYINAHFGEGIVNAGAALNKAEFVVYNEDGQNVTHIYDISAKFGELKIEAYRIAVNTLDQEKIYDGEVLIGMQFELSGLTPLIDGHRIEVVKTTLIIEAGSVKNYMEFAIFDQQDDVSSNYIVECSFGHLSITKRFIEVITHDYIGEYDGMAQNYSFFSIGSSAQLVHGHQVYACGDTAYLTNVGETYNVFEVCIIEPENENDVTKNYEIKYTYGKIEIAKRKLGVRAASGVLIYNAKEQGLLEIESVEGLLDFHEVRINEQMPYSKVLNVGDVKENFFSVEVFEGNQNVSDNYDIAFTHGFITVYPYQIFITSLSQDFFYNGEAQSFARIDEPDLLEGHSYAINQPIVELVDVDYMLHSNVLSINIFDENGTDITFNYLINYSYGTLQVKPRPITIKTQSCEFEYDGEAHYELSYEISSGSLVLDHFVSVQAYEQIVEVGKAQNWHIAQIYNEANEQKTQNYLIDYDYGTLEVTKRTILFFSETAEFEYDGQAHCFSQFVAAKRGAQPLANGHVAIGSGFRYFEDVLRNELGEILSYENTMTIEIFNEYGIDKTYNYDISYSFGRVKILPIEITVRLIDCVLEYSGKPIMSSEFEIVSQKTILESHYALCAANGSQTEIGSSINEIVNFWVFLKESNEDVTHNYKVEFISGTITVTPILIHIIAGSADKIYDTTPLTCEDFYTNWSSLLLNHTLSAQTAGSITDVGFMDNIIIKESVEIVDINGDSVKHLYDIVLYNGILQVGEREITIKTESAQKKYDGFPLTAGGYEVIGELLDGHEYIVNVIGSITEPGSISNLAEVKIVDEHGNNCTDKYVKKYKFGTLKILTDGSSGGGDGGGSGSGNINGNIGGNLDSGGGDGGLHIPVFYATSTGSGLTYFRMESFGDYNMSNWLSATAFQTAEFNPLYLFSSALKGRDDESNHITIEPLMDGTYYMLPYYSLNGYRSLSDTRLDVQLDGAYSMDYIKYQYSLDDVPVVTSAYSGFESIYYNHVLENYLSLPSSTRNGLLAVAAQNGLFSSNPNIIEEVANYVKNLVPYNQDFEKYEGDYALYFFNKASSAVCRHYATAATAMLRALGIPARYTVGYVAPLSENERFLIDTERAHAWVEVYLKGSGWVVLEVTGSGEGNPTEDDSDQNPDLTQLSLKPINHEKVFDGTPLYATNEIEGADESSRQIFEQLLEDGYYYTAEVEGWRVEYGNTPSEILAFSLYDASGRLVNDKYNLIYTQGNVKINKATVYINLYNVSKSYDGTPLSYESDDYWVDLPQGLTLDFELSGSLIDVGQISLDELKELPFRVFYNTIELTSSYQLEFLGTPLTINKRSIEIMSGSSTKSYDGKPLTNSQAWVSKGFIPKNHTFEYVISASISDVGSVKNEIESIKITNSLGQDVTAFFLVTFVYGTLTISN